jgi:hypothetical protein
MSLVTVVSVQTLAIIAFLGSTQGADHANLLFMQGSTQGLGSGKLWSLDLATQEATEKAAGQIPQPHDFSSRGAVCDGVYYTIWWHLVDPQKYAGARVYGLGAFDVMHNFTYSDHPLPDSYFGVWCGQNAGELVVVMSPRPNQDPEQVHDFYVQTISTSTWAVTNVTTTPITAPPDETMPVADGIFDYDVQSNTMWMSWALNARPHINAGATHVVDLSAHTDSTFYTPRDEGYLMNSRAVAGGANTWAVLKSFKKRPSGKEVISLTLVDASLADGSVAVKKVKDVSHTANSNDLPFGSCVHAAPDGNGNATTLYMMNVDEVDFLHPSFNMSAIDAATGQVHWNLDSSTIVGQKFAYVTGFACV